LGVLKLCVYINRYAVSLILYNIGHLFAPSVIQFTLYNLNNGRK
jgi:hypothetical protein